MAKIKYDNALLKLMSFFETVTHTKLRDCFVDDNNVLVFVVEPAQMGLAIGRSGVNAKRLESELKRKIRIVEFSEDIVSFVSGILQPYKAREITQANDVVTINAEPQSRGYIIGRGGSSLKNYEAIVKRYFPIREIKVL